MFQKRTYLEERKRERDFQTINRHQISGKLYNKKDFHVRDDCHVTDRYRVPVFKKYNVAFRLKNRIFVVFHNLRRYGSHLIMQEIGGFDQDFNATSNNMGKCMAFFI